MRIREEVLCAIAELVGIGIAADREGDCEMSRYALKLAQALQWATGEDNEFEKFINPTGRIQ